MEKLKIINKNGYLYNLEDDTGKEYILNIEFQDIGENVDTGAYISLCRELLDPKYEGYSNHYTFGSLESKYGKEINTINDIDVINIETNDKVILLKRLYG